MKYYLVVLFGVMCIAQWYVPGSMIVHQEDILANGKVYHFKTAPIDPNDPFRGKYVILVFVAETMKGTRGSDCERNQSVFVVLGTDQDGFASVTRLAETRPDEGTDFFSATIRYSNEQNVDVQFPFDRFYLEESKAAKAETVYAESNSQPDRGDRETAYAVVRVKDGQAALEDVRIDGRSIVDIVRERQQQESE